MGRPKNIAKVVKVGSDYRIKGTLPNGKRKDVAFPGLTKKEVEAKLKDLILEALQDAPEKKGRRRKFGEAADAYREARIAAEGPSTAIERYLPKAKAYFGDWWLDEIDSEDCRRFAMETYPGCRPQTWNTQGLTIMGAVINWCGQSPKTWGVSGLKIKRFKEDEVVRRTVDDEWLEAFKAQARSMGPVYLGMAELAEFIYMIGPRIGEAIGLEWDRIDWKTNRADLGLTKNGKRQVAEFDEAIADDLRKLRKAQMRLLADADLDGRTRRRLEAGRVFAQNNYQQTRKKLIEVCEAAGIEYVPTHQAGRHSFATRLHKLGWSIYDIAATDRWADPQSVARYIHPELTGRRALAALRGGTHKISTIGS